MHGHELSRTGIAVLDRLGESFDLALEREAMREREAARAPQARWRRRPALAISLAVAACALAIVSVGLWLVGQGGPLSLDDAIARVARTAIAQSPPPEDEYVYTRSRWLENMLTAESRPSETTPVPMLVASERQTWLSIGRPGLVQIRRISVRYGDGHSTRSRSAAPPVEFESRYPAAGAYRIGSRSYTWAQLARFPTEPRAIVERLTNELSATMPADRPVALWQALTLPLTAPSPTLPPELRAGLVRAIGTLPNVRALGEVETPSGKRGQGFVMLDQGLRQTIVFDDNTSAVLFSETEVASLDAARKLGWPVGTVISRYELLEQRLVDELPGE